MLAVGMGVRKNGGKEVGSGERGKGGSLQDWGNPKKEFKKNQMNKLYFKQIIKPYRRRKEEKKNRPRNI